MRLSRARCRRGATPSLRMHTARRAPTSTYLRTCARSLVRCVCFPHENAIGNSRLFVVAPDATASLRLFSRASSIAARSIRSSTDPRANSRARIGFPCVANRYGFEMLMRFILTDIYIYIYIIDDGGFSLPVYGPLNTTKMHANRPRVIHSLHQTLVLG